MELREGILLWSLEWPVAASLVELSVRVSLVVVGALIVSRAIGSQPAALRRVLWISTLLTALLLGLAGAGTAIRVAFEPPLIWQGYNASSARTLFPNPMQYLLWLWLIPSALLLFRLGATQIRLQQLLRQCRPLTTPDWESDSKRIRAELGVQAPVQLLVSSQLESPVTVGVMRPRIVIPESFLDAAAGLREAVLWHELTHVAHRDVAGRWLSAVTCSLHWFNPLVWMAARRLRRECECTSDEAVVDSGVARSFYARHLLALADTQTPQPASLVTLGLGASELRVRIEALADQRVERRSGKIARMGLAVVGTLILVAAWRLQLPQPQFQFIPETDPEAQQTLPPQDS